MKTKVFFRIFFYFLVFLSTDKGFAQGISSKKYQSLLWEISGNGLKNPSYLFGTMHVSSKMVFHLADSFYYALKNVDAVALELNPEIWQPEMANLDKLQHNYKNFIQATPNDYLNEKSFQLDNYEDELRDALQSEPTVVNSLLYRTYKSKEDFEEDTFLDLYIYQTAKKLGKITTGVEDYFSTEKIILEAYADMAKEKKKSYDSNNESPYEMEKKAEDAYRRGDLDLLDSLETILQGSKAFREKFLLKRNEIQANSIDTILKKHSLFVGVGAAHLPGERGVIELLRKKGYKLRPVKMDDRNAFQQNAIDKQKVPVNFYPYKNPDGAYMVSVPGNLYKMSTDGSGLDRSQYADMSNGTYYIITRVQTYSVFWGDPVEKIYKKIDSLLYENIPGKIIDKKIIKLNGYNGIDITNKTRRGDLQRYQIYVTPFEVLVFKMSGKESYVGGPEAAKFFGSIELPQDQSRRVNFEPQSGGFKINLPQLPHQFLNTTVADDIDRWEYEATDKASGNSFLILKKTINNFSFLDQDTFDLDLVNESFRASKFIQEQKNSKHGIFKGYPCMDVAQKLNDGSFIKEKIIIKGPQYFLLAAKTKDSSESFSSFFSSFDFTPFKYALPKQVTDTFMHFTVATPVVPELDENFRALLEKLSNGNLFNSSYEPYWPKTRNAFFKNDSTGEIISVEMQQLPKYYQIKSGLDFRREEIKNYLVNNDMVLSSTDSFSINKNITAYSFTIRDTNSSRSIKRLLIVNKDRLYRIAAMTDTTGEESVFIKTFLLSFSPMTDSTDFNIYANKKEIFFKDFYNKDSATHTKVLAALPNIYYTQKDIPQLSAIIQSLQYGDKEYFDTKSKVIRELGYIQEPGAAEPVVKFLKRVYENTADTSTFQNNVIKALAKNETKESYNLLKDLLIQDPPLFENANEYSDLFDDIQDSLLLAKKLFPEILQLLTIDDYKDKVTSLLVNLVDSNLIAAKDYADFFTKIYFDAKIELKKQQAKDEKLMRKESNEDDSGTEDYDYGHYTTSASKLSGYATLLMPFYDKKPAVAKFMDKLLLSKDAGLQLDAVTLLLKNKKNVPDSILISLAASDRYRAVFYEAIKKLRLEEKFPTTYRTQQQIAKSILVAENGYSKMDSVQFISSTTVDYNGKKGSVYFFKYRIKEEDDWKIGISGVQPFNKNEISTDEDLVKLTDKKINSEEALDTQFEQELNKMLILSHKSGREFYLRDEYNRFGGE